MKKGFVFIETLVVLVVLIAGILSIFSTYAILTSNIEKREYYDNISDLYKVDIIRSLIDVDAIGEPTDYITKNNCSNIMQSNCIEILESLNVEKIYINTTVSINDMIDESESYLPSANNSLIEYIKTIKDSTSRRYIIVNFYYNNHNYYASLYI